MGFTHFGRWLDKPILFVRRIYVSRAYLGPRPRFRHADIPRDDANVDARHCSARAAITRHFYRHAISQPHALS